MAIDSFTKGEWNRTCSAVGELGDEWEVLARECDFFWDDGMTVGNGILGKFYPRNRIHLPVWGRGITDKSMVPTVVHELVHYKQYCRLGWLLYAIGNVTRINEIEARAFEAGAEKELGLCFMSKGGRDG